MSSDNSEQIKANIREGYSKIAKTGSWSAIQSDNSYSGCCTGGGCCGPTNFSPEELAKAIGYSSGELAVAPEGANMGLSCGNPSAIASLKLGETVLDLGSGGGFDCFITGPKVGATGRVIGVDMTSDMLTKARANIDFYKTNTGLNNVEFRLGEIEHLPVADSSVDVVLSNCVINLSTDKQQVWNEIFRVLKPNGRVAISDLALLKPLPQKILQDVEALVGCVAGASLVSDIQSMMSSSGFKQIILTPKSDYIDAMVNMSDPLYVNIMKKLPQGAKVSDYVVSLDIQASK
jgi:arsenite methyltransferase